MVTTLLSLVLLASAPLVDRAVVHQDRTRTYHVFVPEGHDPARRVPLVVALHGGGGTGTQLEAGTGGTLAREAGRRGWILVFPDGVARGWNDGRPLPTRRARQRAGVDDVGFLAAVIDRVQAEWKTDPRRVYVTGISNGGFMSFRLAVDVAGRIAAAAPVAAQMTPFLAARRPARPVPILLVNGTEDPLVPYEGGHVTVLGRDHGAVLSTDRTIAWWLEKDGCPRGADAKPPTVAWLPDATRDGTRVERTTWTPCRGGAEVELLKVVGGGHTWPGGRRNLPRLVVGRLSRDLDASKAIFDFFARHRAPAPAARPARR